MKLAMAAFGGWNVELDSAACGSAMLRLLAPEGACVKGLANWQFALLVLGAIGLGAVLSLIIGRDRKATKETPEPGSTIVLADPLDPPQRGLPEPPAEGAAVASTDPSVSPELGDRTKLTAAKEALKARVRDGSASDSQRRMLKALCRQLGDESCAN